MGGYRDDLGAAVARADALQQEVDELKAELARLRSGTGRVAPTARTRHNLGAYVALGAMFVFVGAMVMLVLGWSIPVPARAPAPTVFVEFEGRR
jgi:hypothetical protein